MALFEGYERKIDKINGVLAQYGISSVEECKTICEEKGFDPYTITKNIQPICFEDAAWAYTVGAAIAIKTKPSFTRTGRFTSMPSLAKSFSCSSSDISGSFSFRDKARYARPLVLKNLRSGSPLAFHQAYSSFSEGRLDWISRSVYATPWASKKRFAF